MAFVEQIAESVACSSIVCGHIVRPALHLRDRLIQSRLRQPVSQPVGQSVGQSGLFLPSGAYKILQKHVALVFLIVT